MFVNYRSFTHSYTESGFGPNRSWRNLWRSSWSVPSQFVPPEGGNTFECDMTFITNSHGVSLSWHYNDLFIVAFMQKMTSDCNIISTKWQQKFVFRSASVLYSVYVVYWKRNIAFRSSGIKIISASNRVRKSWQQKNVLRRVKMQSILNHSGILILEQCLNEQAPIKKLSKAKQKLSHKPWITPCLLKSIKTKNRLSLSRPLAYANEVECVTRWASSFCWLSRSLPRKSSQAFRYWLFDVTSREKK